MSAQATRNAALRATTILVILGASATAAETSYLAPPPESLRQALATADYAAAISALNDLRELGPEAVDALPVVLKALDADDANVKIHAARCLASLGPEARECVPTCIRLLRQDIEGDMAADVGPLLADALCDCLVALGPEGEAFAHDVLHLAVDAIGTQLSNKLIRVLAEMSDMAIPAVITALESPSDAYRFIGSAVLSRAHSRLTPTPALFNATVALLADPSSYQAFPVGERRPTDDALAALVSWGKASEIYIDRALLNSDPFVRLRAAAVRLAVRYDAAAIRILIDGLRATDQQSEALRILQQCGPNVGPAIPAAVELLEHSKDAVTIAEAIQAVLPTHAAVVNVVTLIESRLASPDAPLRLQAIDDLGRLTPASLPTLVSALGHEDSEVRMAAAIALERVGTSAHSAVPALLRNLEMTREPHHAHAYLRALATIGVTTTHSSYLRVIVDWLVQAPFRNGSSVLMLCSQIGPRALPLCDALLLDGGMSPDVRVIALRVVSEIGVDSVYASQILLRELENHARSDGELSEVLAGLAESHIATDEVMAALDAACATGLHSSIVIPALHKKGVYSLPIILRLLSDGSLSERVAAIQQLGRLRDRALLALDHVVAAFRSEEAVLRASAVQALVAIAEHKNEVSKLVVEAVSDVDARVRVASAFAIGEMSIDRSLMWELQVALLYDENVSVQTAALSALFQAEAIGGDTAQRVRDLQQSHYASVRLLAVRVARHWGIE